MATGYIDPRRPVDAAVLLATAALVATGLRVRRNA